MEEIGLIVGNLSRMKECRDLQLNDICVNNTGTDTILMKML